MEHKCRYYKPVGRAECSECGLTTAENLLERLLGVVERAMEERCGCWERKCAYHTIKEEWEAHKAPNQSDAEEIGDRGREDF